VVDLAPTTNYTTTRIDAVNNDLTYYPAGLVMNNGEFLATYKKGSDTFYNKKNC
jgi:hypothetical protein